MSENEKNSWQKVKALLKKVLFFLANPRLLVCLAIGWIITNGWSYAMLAAGMHFNISWMTKLSSSYIALLWFPFTPEKLVTVAIAIALLRWLFPNDQNTLGLLKAMLQRLKEKKAAKKEKNDSKAATSENDRNASR